MTSRDQGQVIPTGRRAASKLRTIIAVACAALAALGPASAHDGHSETVTPRFDQTIADDPTHPLRFLIDPKTGAGRGRSHLSEEPGVQAGHMVSRHSGAPETFAVEDAFFNQVSNWRGEMQGAVFEKPAVEIGGIPVEGRTASMWQRLGIIP